MLEVVEKDPSPKLQPPLTKPRRPFQFGIGTLLVVTTMYAVLFAILRACNAPPLTFVAVTLFFTAVGFGQRFLFEGRRPGRASMIVGACYFVGLYFVDRVAFGDKAVYHPYRLIEPVERSSVRSNVRVPGQAAD